MKSNVSLLDAQHLLRTIYNMVVRSNVCTVKRLYGYVSSCRKLASFGFKVVSKISVVIGSLSEFSSNSYRVYYWNLNSEIH